MKQFILIILVFGLIIPNKFVFAQCAGGEAEVTVKIRTDEYGSETTWTLSDGTTTYLSGGPYTDGSLIDDVQTVCITEGTNLTFTINDSYGDGMCSGSGDGYYQILAYNFIFGEGCSYTTQETVQFTLESPSNLDCELSSLNFGDYISQEFTLKGKIYNNGLNTLTSVDFSWQIDGGPVNTETISSFSIQSNEYAEITHSSQLASQDSLTNNDFKIWISNPNSSADENTLNDTIEITSYVLDEWVNRRALIEHFTNASCGPCASQNPTLKTLMETGTNPDNIAHIAYHTSWPGTDPMFDFNNANEQDDMRVTYYSVSGVPDAIVGGDNYQGGPAGISQNMIDDEIKIPGFFKITSDQAIWDDTIEVNLEITAMKNMSSNIVAHIALIEDMEYDEAPGSNGEKEFENVMRFMLSGENGYALTNTNAADITNIDIKKKINTYVIDDPKLIVFIQDNADKDILMSYLYDTDFAPPALSSNVINGQPDVNIDAVFQFSFNDPVRKIDNSQIIDPTSLLTLREDNETGTVLSFSTTINSNKNLITLTPDQWFAEEKTYYVSFTENLEDENDLVYNKKGITFTTKIMPKPVVKFSIENGATDIKTDTTITLNFNEPVRNIDNSAIANPKSFIIFKEDDQNGADVAYNATINDGKNKVTITTTTGLKEGQNYYLAVEEEVENIYDKTLESSHITFTTYQAVINNIDDNPTKDLFNVFPNPVKDMLEITIDSDSYKTASISIYNESGQLKFTKKIGGENTLQINMSEYPEGVYFIKLKNNQETQTKKILHIQ